MNPLISMIPFVVLAVILFLILREPIRKAIERNKSNKSSVKTVIKPTVVVPTRDIIDKELRKLLEKR